MAPQALLVGALRRAYNNNVVVVDVYIYCVRGECRSRATLRVARIIILFIYSK